jgi:hypothetical protein
LTISNYAPKEKRKNTDKPRNCQLCEKSIHSQNHSIQNSSRLHHFNFDKFSQILNKFLENFELLSQEVLTIDLIEPFFRHKTLNGHAGQSACSHSQSKTKTERREFLKLLEKGKNSFQNIWKYPLEHKSLFYQNDTDIMNNILQFGMTPSFVKNKANSAKGFETPTMKMTEHHQDKQLVFSSIHSSIPQQFNAREPPTVSSKQTTPAQRRSRSVHNQSPHLTPKQKLFSFNNHPSPRHMESQGKTSLISKAFSGNIQLNLV